MARAAKGRPLHSTGRLRFGIEPHEAPVSEFPMQPSRKDGLGTMCAEHWRAYVKGLREARQVAKASEGNTDVVRELGPAAEAVAEATEIIS
jgi:hypothetical protein